MTTHKMKATYPIMTTHTMHYDRKNKSLPIISSSPLPLFKPGMVTIHDEKENNMFSFTFIVNNTPHQSSHFFERAHEAKARMRDLVKSYNELYERFK